MSYAAYTRDRFRLAATGITGMTAIGALSATGWLAGVAAQNFEAEQADKAAQAAAADAQRRAELRAWRQATRAAQARPRVVLRPRPQRTHVTVRYVQAVPSARVGPGGTVSAVEPAGPAPAPADQAAPAPAPAAASAPPPPPPPPPPAAPSSGS
jgi:hypothetical protein